MKPLLTRRRVWIARGVAVLADLVQLGLAPLFIEGGLSVLDAVLDVVVAGILTFLVGWHWAFLPAFLVEFTPGLDLVPSWTLAVLLATRDRGTQETIPPPGRVIDAEVVREKPRDQNQ
jgi:hypothetical protein